MKTKTIKDMKWVINKSADELLVKQLAEKIKVDENIARLLVQRQICSYDDARSFFRPDINEMHDPFLMKDMKKAVLRIEEAVTKDENIMIYGDYDVDGTTAVAMVFRCLSDQTPHLTFYIPDRYKEGYGISVAGIDKAVAEDITLIIALDCGIRAIENVQYAREKGIDMIICDHHTPGEKLPEAFAILNPKRHDCEYPFKELSGCGIGYKLLQAYYLHTDIDFEKKEYALQLSTISTACDIVPMIGENRVLVFYGLKSINAEAVPGVDALINLNRRQGELNVSDLVFMIGPKLNAAGRIDHGSKAVQLLLAENQNEASEAAKPIEEFNKTRKEIDHKTLEDALEFFEQDEDLKNAKSTVLYKPDWHHGVLGIVASRLIEHYYRPTVILSGSNGLATGSARSVKGFDINRAIEQCSDLLERYGGHKYAAGLSMKTEFLKEFRLKFEEVVQEAIGEESLSRELNIDLEIDFDDITPKFHHIIKRFAPFGPQNMKLVFVTRNAVTVNHKLVGQDEAHLSMYVKQQGGEHLFNCIAFNMSDKEALVRTDPFDIVYTIEERVWNETTSVQLKVKDIRKSTKG